MSLSSIGWLHFVKLCGDMRGHVVLWSLSLFVLERQDRPLNIFPPRQETGCEALFYGWRASTFYPESPSLNVLRSCKESCWSSSNDWTEMVERLRAQRLCKVVFKEAGKDGTSNFLSDKRNSEINVQPKESLSTCRPARCEYLHKYILIALPRRFL